MTELESKLAAARAELAAVESQIAAEQTAARADNIAAVRALMASHGLTVADLGHAGAARAPKADKQPSPARAPTHRSETGQEWAGRGKRPGWLSNALAGGRTLDSFRIGA